MIVLCYPRYGRQGLADRETNAGVAMWRLSASAALAAAVIFGSPPPALAAPAPPTTPPSRCQPTGPGDPRGDGLFPVEVGDRTGFMDQTGRMVIQPQFASASRFHDGRAKVYLVPFGGDLLDVPSDAYLEQEQRGFIDTKGVLCFIEHLVKPPVPQPNTIFFPSTIGPFSDGRALADLQSPSPSANRGYIDGDGRPVIGPQFDINDDFSEGLAVVTTYGRSQDPSQLFTRRFIDPSGKIAIGSFFADARRFSEGLAAVRAPGAELWGYIDKSGAFVIPPTFRHAWDFSEGYAVVEIDGGLTLIDKRGTVSGAPAAALGRFSHGLAPINVGGRLDRNEPQIPDEAIGGKWGFRDAAGAIVIAPQFDYARSFSEGLAAVNMGGVNHSSVSEGGNVVGGKWGYVDASGQWVVQAQFSEGDDFQGHLARVVKGGGAVYITPKGEEIKPTGVMPRQPPQVFARRPAKSAPANPQAINLARLGAADLVATAMSDALSPNRPGQTTTYTFYQRKSLEAAVRAFTRNAPRPPKPHRASQASVMTPDVRAQAAELRKAAAECATRPEDEGRGAECKLMAEINDYENILGDPLTTPVSEDTARLSWRLDDATRTALERRLNDIMDGLRRQVLSDKARSHDARNVQPVAVKIIPSRDLNIQARFGASTLPVSEGLLEDVYLRAAHRAIISLRIRNDSAGQEDPAFRVFSTDFARLSYLEQNLPNLQLHYLSGRRFGQAIAGRCETSEPGAREQVADLLRASGDQDFRMTYVYAMPALVKYMSCASDMRRNDGLRFLGELALAQTPAYEDVVEAYMPLAAEKLQLDGQISAEMTKALTFILAHESYHLWSSATWGEEAEYRADAQGIQLYYELFGRTDVNALLSNTAFGREFLHQSDVGLALSFAEIVGRDPVTLLTEIYSGTQYYGGEESHPPVARRVQRIRQFMKAQRLFSNCRTTLNGAPMGSNRFPLDFGLPSCAELIGRARHAG